MILQRYLDKKHDIRVSDSWSNTQSFSWSNFWRNLRLRIPLEIYNIFEAVHPGLDTQPTIPEAGVWVRSNKKTAAIGYMTDVTKEYDGITVGFSCRVLGSVEAHHFWSICASSIWIAEQCVKMLQHWLHSARHFFDSLFYWTHFHQSSLQRKWMRFA
jgi:hypothetical protein